MAKLDRFFQAMFDRKAQQLQLVSGRSPAFLLQEGLQPASSVQPNREQVLGLLGEILEDGTIEKLHQTGELTLPVQRPDLPPMSLVVKTTSSNIEAIFSPSTETGGAPRPATPDPALAESPSPAPPAASSPVAPAPTVAPGQAEVGGTAAPGMPASTPPTNPAREPLTPPAVPSPAPPASSPSPQAGPAHGAVGGPPAIDTLFREMVEAGASDLHLSADETPILRVDGEIRRMEGQQPRSGTAIWKLLEPITPERNIEEFESSHDTDFAYEIPALARFRCNIFRDRKGPGAVFRTIPSKILTAEDLGLSPHILDLCKLSKGLVLVTGPTGSGKSTTLTAMVDHINKTRTDHIITIEDPIEFVHDNIRCLVNQREVSTHTQSFKRALRAALREDPDIVLVGEMRDLETIAIAIETAETGHLVFGTLHTSTAVSTIDRIIDQFPSGQQAQVRTMLSESLKGVIAQTLCKKIGGGRVAALEVLIGISSVANLIREGKTFQIPSIMQTGRKHGMITLNEALMDLYREKLISAEQAYVKAVDKTGISGALKNAGADMSFLATAQNAGAAVG